VVAYSFTRRFVEPILIGLEPGPPKPGAKRQTIRAERRSRHARVGERMQLYFAMRSKQCRFLGEPRCVGVWPITMRFIPEPAITIEGCRRQPTLMPSPEATDFQGVGTSCKSFGPSFMPGQWPRNLAGYFSGDTRRSRGPVESRRTRALPCVLVAGCFPLDHAAKTSGVPQNRGK